MANVWTSTFSPDSRFFLVHDVTPQNKSAVAKIYLYDLRSFRLLWSRTAPTNTNVSSRLFDRVLFSPDNRFVITSSMGELQWLDRQTSKLVHRRTGSDVRFSPDGRTMALSTSRGIELQSAP
jgi:WD40 repeat protein